MRTLFIIFFLVYAVEVYAFSKIELKASDRYQMEDPSGTKMYVHFFNRD